MKWLIAFAFLAACTSTTITSFEDCVAAQYPIMESFPRQCSAEGKTFVEEIQVTTFDECLQIGGVINEGVHTTCTYNNITFDNPKVALNIRTCESPRPESCPEYIDPVCAFKDNGIRCIQSPCPSTDAITLSNSCFACANIQVSGHYPNSCEENTLVVCEETITGFDIASMAIEQGWICVDICPGNFDTFTTQIGAKMCITHYGLDEINSWTTCPASSDNCNCVLTTETTSGEQIDQPEFKCVPNKYAERLLFTSGQTHLDEKGAQSTIIA